MGYTNYWKIETNTDEYTQEKYQTACERIAEFIGDENQADNYWSVFLSGECEDFALPHRISNLERFNFCKTNRHDYDREVMGSLFILKHYVPEIIIQSDGQNNDGSVETIVGEAYSAYFDFMKSIYCSPKSMSELFGTEITENLPESQQYMFVENREAYRSLIFDHITKEFVLTEKRNGIEKSLWIGSSDELIDVLLAHIGGVA